MYMNTQKRICVHFWPKKLEDSWILDVMCTKGVRRTNNNLSKSNILTEFVMMLVHVSPPHSYSLVVCH